MSLLAAARVGDPIQHSSMMAMLLKASATLVTGVLVGLATKGIGLLLFGGPIGWIAAAAIGAVVALAMNRAGLLDGIESAIGSFADKAFPPTITGKIVYGSPNVSINSKSAARAIPDKFPGDMIACARHDPPECVAEGAETVFINNWRAHRKDESTTCGGKTAKGSPNVLIGGESVPERAIKSEKPWWLRGLEYIGLAIGLCRGKGWGKLARLACMAANFAVAKVVEGAINFAFPASAGKPVHAPTGAKILQGPEDEDFALPAVLPLVWQRNYNSRDRAEDTLFGPGWRTELDIRLCLAPEDGGSHTATLTDPTGIETAFEPLAPREKQTNPHNGWTLAHTPQGWAARSPEGLNYCFGRHTAPTPATLRLRVIQDDNGNLIGLHYEDDLAPDGTTPDARQPGGTRLIQILDNAKRLLELHYDDTHPQRLARITWPAAPQRPLLVRYEYDAQGRLAEVHNRLNKLTRRFTWYDKGPGTGLLASHTLPDNLVCTYEWAHLPGEEHPRVVRHTTSAHESWTFNYQLPDARTPHGQTEVIDHLGRRQHWQWQADSYNIERYTDPEGRLWQVHWNARGLVERCIQPNGAEWRLGYDDEDRLISVLNPLGHTEHTEWGTPFELPVKETDALGQTTTYRYDRLGNLLELTHPGGTQRFQYDHRGLLTEHTDERGGSSRWQYDTLGQLHQHTDCSGRRTQYDYDPEGRLAWRIDPDGVKTEFGEDLLHRLVRIDHPDGSWERWRYAAGGQVSHYIRAANAAPAANAPPGTPPALLEHCTEYRYDLRGDIHEIIDPTGQRIRFEPNDFDRSAAILDPGMQRTRFEFNQAGEQIAQVGIDGIRTEYVLDALGLPIEVRQYPGEATPPGGGEAQAPARLIQLERDLLGQLTCKRTAETVTRYYYDPLGRLQYIQRYTLESPFDGRNTLLDEIAFEWSPAGDLLSEQLVTYALLQPTATGTEAVPLGAPRMRTLTHAHDPLGNLTATTLPGGQTLNWLHYGSGHLHQINIDGEIVTDIERDLLHRETQRTQGVLSTQLQRDIQGRILRKHTHNPSAPAHARFAPGKALQQGFTKYWRYDPLGRLNQRDDRLQGTQHYRYDPLEQLLESRNTAPAHAGTWSQIAEHARRSLTERFTWDAAANALPVDPTPAHSNGPAQGRVQGHVQYNRVLVWRDLRYTYDTLGRVIRRQDPAHDLHLKWNCENQLIETARQGAGGPQHTRYHYDPLGRRIAVQSQGEDLRVRTQWFTWGGMRLLQQEWATRQDATDHWHHARHRLDAPCHTFLYEDAGSYEPLARLQHGLKEKIEARHIQYFHTDLNGAPEEMTDTEGRILWQSRYRAWGETVLEQWHPDEENPYVSPEEEQNLRYQGQYLDRDTGLHFNTFRYYDPATGRFLCQDPIGLMGGMNLYQYAPNALGWIDPWGWAKGPCASDIKKLQTGPKGTSVTVRTKKEADALLKAAFPNAQKVRGVGPQDSVGLRKKTTMEAYKDDWRKDGRARYRKDYSVDRSTGRVRGHPDNSSHGDRPHINIRRPGGTEVRIDIDPGG